MAYVERLIYTALADGMAALQRDPRQLDILFRNGGLDRSEAAVLRAAFLLKSPMVVHGYPRQDSAFPLFAIILGDEKESQLFLDDSGGLLSPEEAQLLGVPGEVGADVRTSVYTHEYNIWTVTYAPDETIAYYAIAKYLLSRKRPFFHQEGIHKVQFSGGDYAPDGRYIPAELFVRRLTMTCESEERFVDPDTGEGLIHSVDGIFVDDGSDQERIGKVETLVSTFER